MKFGLLLCVMFSIAVFAGVSAGQSETNDGARTRLIVGTDSGIWTGALGASHVKVFDGNSLSSPGIYVGVNERWTRLSNDDPGHSISAGSTIRLRIASTNNQGKLIVGVDKVDLPVRSAPGGRLYLATEVGVYLIPCGNSARSTRGYTGLITLTSSSTVGEFNWKTDRRLRGSCQTLIAKFPDGQELRGMLRFE